MPGIITEQGFPFGEGCGLGYSPLKEEDAEKVSKESRNYKNKKDGETEFWFYRQGMGIGISPIPYALLFFYALNLHV